MSYRSPVLMCALLLSAAMITPVLAQENTPVKEDQVVVEQMVDPLNPSVQEADMAKVYAARPGVQTLQDVLRSTYDANPTLQATRAQLQATQERLPQAQAGWKPSAAASASATYIDSKTGSAASVDTVEKSIGIDASQPVYRGGRTTADIDSAKNAIMAQRAFMIAKEQEVLLQVATAYMDVLRDQSLHDLAVNNKDVIARQLDATKTRFDVGDVTRTDVSQSQARLAGTESTRVRALGNLRGSLAVLQQVSGMPPATLAFPDITLPLPPTLDDTIAAAERYNPGVLAAKYIHSAAQKDIDSVFGELLPNVGLFGSVDYTADPIAATTSVDHQTISAFGIQASIPLYEAGATRSRIRAAKNTAMQRGIEISEATRLARQQAISNWENLQAAKSEITSRKAQVKAAALSSEGVGQESQLGTRTILDVLNAEQELLDVKSALVTAQRNEVVASFALAGVLGMLNPDVLGFPELYRDYEPHLRDITGKIFSTDTGFDPDRSQKPQN